METMVSSKGQIVLPAAVRRKLRLTKGERLEVDLREDGVFLRPICAARPYKAATHPVSGLPVMTTKTRGARKVTAGEIARLSADLL
ncbi:MAG TPA: AbrB/MazE/SpoVT family DNA-binding domain-containing protein [Opitutaceae bacterium]